MYGACVLDQIALRVGHNRIAAVERLFRPQLLQQLLLVKGLRLDALQLLFDLQQQAML